MTQNDRDDDGVLDLLGRHYNNLTSFCHGILQKHFSGTSQLETFFSVLGIGPIPWIIMSEVLCLLYMDKGNSFTFAKRI